MAGLIAMFHVKICGVTTPTDARLAVDSGADAIGINFVAGSPRCASAEVGREVAAAVRGRALVVGVFAGSPPEEIRRIATAVGLDAIQLHGRLFEGDAVDSPATCAALAPMAVIRAVRLGAGGFAETRRWIDAARAAGHGPCMVVVDAAVAPGAAAGRLGGTGHTVDWGSFVEAGDPGVPVALAGGLTPDNVTAAVEATGVRAVDTASGVEAAPGRKDPTKVREFCAAARRALEAGRS